MGSESWRAGEWQNEKRNVSESGAHQVLCQHRVRHSRNENKHSVALVRVWLWGKRRNWRDRQSGCRSLLPSCGGSSTKSGLVSAGGSSTVCVGPDPRNRLPLLGLHSGWSRVVESRTTAV